MEGTNQTTEGLRGGNFQELRRDFFYILIIAAYRRLSMDSHELRLLEADFLELRQVILAQNATFDVGPFVSAPGSQAEAAHQCAESLQSSPAEEYKKIRPGVVRKSALNPSGPSRFERGDLRPPTFPQRRARLCIKFVTHVTAFPIGKD